MLEYGASAQKNIADFSDTALAKVKTGDLGEIGTMLSGLLVELKTMDEPEKKGIAGLFRKAKINAEEMKSPLLQRRRSTSTASPASWKSTRSRC